MKSNNLDGLIGYIDIMPSPNPANWHEETGKSTSHLFCIDNSLHKHRAPHVPKVPMDGRELSQQDLQLHNVDDLVLLLGKVIKTEHASQGMFTVMSMSASTMHQ